MVLLMVACTRCGTTTEIVPVTAELEGSTPVRVEVGSMTAAGEVGVEVRLVNAYGVAIPGDFNTVDVSIAGSILNITTDNVTLDSMGYGVVLVSSSIPQEITVTPTGSADGATSGEPKASWITSADAPEVGLYGGWPTELAPEFMVAVESGMVLGVDETVLWQDGDFRTPAQEVARFPTAIEGLAGSDIDADGIPDVVAWTSSEVVLMRGRAGGGFTWGGGFEVPGHSIAGAALGDVDGDNVPDLVIAFGDGNSGGFQVLHGDGVWGWEPALPYQPDITPWSVAVGEVTAGDGAEIVLLTEGSSGLGTVHRLAWSDGNWVEAGIVLGGTDITPPLEEGSRLLPCEDLDGDGAAEIVAVGPPSWDALRVLAFWTFKTNAKQYVIDQYAGWTLSLGDVSGDGIADLVMAEGDPEQLRIVTSDHNEASEFLNRAVASIHTGGPVGVGDFTSDGVPDVIIASEVLALYPGRAEFPWDLADDGFVTFGVYSHGVAPLLVEDWDGDGWPEIVAIRKPQDANETTLRVYHLEPDDGDSYRLVSQSDHEIDLEGTSGTAVAEGLDLARCGESLFALTEDNGQWLWAADADLATGAITEIGVVEASGHKLACGNLGSASVVVVDEVGTWTSYDGDLDEVDSGSIGEVVGDIAIADTDGSGAAIVTCPAEDCSIEKADLDGDGMDEVLVGGSDPSASGWQLDFDFGLGGEVSIMDLDDDGRLDVAFTDTTTSRVAVYRSLETAFAPALVFHVRRSFSGPARMADADGDGQPELFFANGDGNLLRSGLSSER
ncbi:MAG TPA: VCBS repeat-containing protein [Myxococcota bacterium]|nr:VCBS repeat-containing protein [Myxococcota bacterium]